MQCLVSGLSIDVPSPASSPNTVYHACLLSSAYIVVAIALNPSDSFELKNIFIKESGVHCAS